MALYQDLQPVIQLIDNLKDCGIEQKISLPRIVVIGSQSAGKSSLLESIVGLDFLPRGDGVVTRRPLELRLVHLDNQDAQPYAVFEDQKDTEYNDFLIVKKKIEEKTNQVAGQRKKIVNDPIVLTICSPHCLDLSMVDLPGITRVPMKNSDQTEDIERITTDMTNHYIRDGRTIILCVVPANADVTNSDALNLARKVDPAGERTLGVLTKIDIMDKGTSIIPTLKNDVVALKHGYIAVKNRSQADIMKNMDIQEALENERDYFQNHKELRGLSEQVGTEKLAEKLSHLLHKHIMTCLPDIDKEINEMMRSSEKILQQLGQPFPTDSYQKFSYISNKVKDVADKVREIMEGKSTFGNSKQFQGYANFNLLVSKFQNEKSKLFVSGLKELPVVDVILEIVEFKGLSLPGFLPKEIIDRKIQNELEKLKSPVYDFIDDVKEHNQRILKSVFEGMATVGGKVKGLLQQKASEYLDDLTEKTRKYIEELIDIEKDMIWTSDALHFAREIPESYFANMPKVYDEFKKLKEANRDTTINRVLLYIKTEIPDFDLDVVKLTIKDVAAKMRGNPALKPKLEQIKNNKLEVTNIVSEDEVIHFYDKLIRYYNIVGRNLNDTIPKIVGKMMMKDFFTHLEDYFMITVRDNIEELNKITEDRSIQKKRENYQDIVAKLRKSKRVLSSFYITMNSKHEEENEYCEFDIE